MEFVAHKEEGLAAKEVVSWGIGFGGLVQGEALKDKKHLKNDIDYFHVKEDTFVSINDQVDHEYEKKYEISSEDGLLFKAIHSLHSIQHKICKIILNVFGWKLDAKQGSLELESPEYLIYGKNREECSDHDLGKLVMQSNIATQGKKYLHASAEDGHSSFSSREIGEYFNSLKLSRIHASEILDEVTYDFFNDEGTGAIKSDIQNQIDKANKSA